MLLVGLALTVAFIASWGASLGLLSHELNLWWELALLVVIMLLGHWIEMRSLARTSSALDSLADLLPDEAEKIDGDEVVAVSPDELEVGDVVTVTGSGYNPAGNGAPVRIGQVTGLTGGSGDFAFDSLGNLYLISGAGTSLTPRLEDPQCRFGCPESTLGVLDSGQSARHATAHTAKAR